MNSKPSGVDPAKAELLEEIEAYYDDYGSWYEEERRGGYYEIINELEFEKIEDAVRGRDALEIGCGTGLILEKTREIARSAQGVDLSEGMLATSRRKGLHVQQASATKLPFADDSFDVTYSFKVFPHIPNVELALSEAMRVTKPDGRLYIEFYNPFSFKALANQCAFLLRGKRVYCRFDSLSKIKSYLPSSWSVNSTRGIRIFGPISTCYTLPVIRPLFRRLDRAFCDSELSRFGGYYVVEIAAVSGS